MQTTHDNNYKWSKIDAQHRRMQQRAKQPVGGPNHLASEEKLNTKVKSGKKEIRNLRGIFRARATLCCRPLAKHKYDTLAEEHPEKRTEPSTYKAHTPRATNQ